MVVSHEFFKERRHIPTLGHSPPLQVELELTLLRLAGIGNRGDTNPVPGFTDGSADLFFRRLARLCCQAKDSVLLLFHTVVEPTPA